MNNLSNHVLAVLFSWMRTLIQGVWGTISSGTTSGFWTWLGDHWLPLTVLLCLICVVLDYLIWLIRWRPYILWKQKILRLFRRDEESALRRDRHFSEGYRSGVGLNLQGLADAPSAPPPALWEAEVYTAPPAPVQEEFAEIPAFEQIEYAAMEDEYEPLPVQEPAPDEIAPPPQPRRRRSDRHPVKRRSLFRRIIADEDENSQPAELPPVIDRETAFHTPVYPRSSPYAFRQQNNDQNGNE